jgi:hypothetical protein
LWIAVNTIDNHHHVRPAGDAANSQVHPQSSSESKTNGLVRGITNLFHLLYTFR